MIPNFIRRILGPQSFPRTKAPKAAIDPQVSKPLERAKSKVDKPNKPTL